MCFFCFFLQSGLCLKSVGGVDGKPLHWPSSASSSSAGPAGSDPAQSSGGRAAEAGQGRGPDHEPRTRRTFRDEGENPENPDDWTNFDIGKVVRLFRDNKQLDTFAQIVATLALNNPEFMFDYCDEVADSKEYLKAQLTGKGFNFILISH